ncbi:solute carrier family 12 member 9 [Schistocerca nitens]|uniref:solute carrier family 12 member 9 n=1 Tax=Schistocerca nitens TaxID=7011 RepID=UPI0021195924|nr:solute carrier family 12 member 9 [Schistocerca nitens]
MLSPEEVTINPGPFSSASDTSVPVIVQREDAPLISRRKFFWKWPSAANPFSKNSNNNNNNNNNNGRTLGTFAGVFSPVALSMFSALLFLRVGFIVGNAGLAETILQFVIAYGILLFTVVSVCAVSTNGAVEGGGAYFMISRTLGPEFGGAIGTLMFFANIVSSALYITGCAEGLVEIFGPSGYLVHDVLPDGRWWRFLYCSGLNVLNLLVCLVGASMFAKTSVLVFGIVCICLISVIVSFLSVGPMQIPFPEANHLVKNASERIGMYTGLSASVLHENLFENYGKDYTREGEIVTFASLFGVLFSGVTGIMAGANMSGELKNPARNIPQGTLSAVGFTFICYIVVSLLTAATCSGKLLQNNYLFMMPINWWPPFVAIGIITATFSASLSNLIGTSRVLEALAKDNVFGRLLYFIVRGSWNGNPVVAVLMSWFLVQLVLLIGSLNTIAQINSVLFLLSYCATNLACLGLELAAAPNFRPSFKYFTWHTALFGLIGTMVMMFVIDTIYASCSIILCLLLVTALHLFSPSRGSRWGSITQALIFHQVRKYLLLLDSRKDHVKFWRPQMLLLVSNPRTSCPLIHFVNDLKKSGLYVLGHVKIGDFRDHDRDVTAYEYTHWLELVDHLKVKAFIELTVAKTVREGMHHMIRMSGLGAMKPNTIVLGFYDDSTPKDFLESSDSGYHTNTFSGILACDGIPLFKLRRDSEEKHINRTEFVGMMVDVLKMKKNLCVCRHFQTLDKVRVARSSAIKYIDVWPINFFNPNDLDHFDTTSLFMMQLACIINMVPGWKKLHLRVFLCETGDQQLANLSSSLDSADTSATPLKGEQRLRELLQMLRIAATIHLIPSYSELYVTWRSTSGSGYQSASESSATEYNSHRANLQYLQSVNQIINQNSSETAATFIYLPPPPSSVTVEESEVYPKYLELLTTLTENLPPTVLVHGVHAVTSTAF